MFEFMGVRVDPVREAVSGNLRKLTGPIEAGGKAAPGGGHAFDARLNDSFRALNLLLGKGVAVRRMDQAAQGFRPGDFAVMGAPEAALAAAAKETGVDFVALKPGIPLIAHEVKRLRTGMYQRYGGGNIDEGWTRLLLEQFGFPYTTLLDAEIKKGGLNEKYDVIILPDDSTAAITGDRSAASGRAGGERSEGAPSRREEGIPPDYRSGIGNEGVNTLKAFVQKGGTLVTLGGAGNFAIEKLELSVRNVVTGRPSKEFWCPGSTLRVVFDNANPLAYGMPPEGLALHMSGSPAFEIIPGEHNERYEVIVRYAGRDLLESGWLIGEQTLARKAGMVAAKYGDGRVILIGFRTQHRAQTHGTFKLLFNALIR
jgi:hypothetical protein